MTLIAGSSAGRPSADLAGEDVFRRRRHPVTDIQSAPPPVPDRCRRGRRPALPGSGSSLAQSPTGTWPLLARKATFLMAWSGKCRLASTVPR